MSDLGMSDAEAFYEIGARTNFSFLEGVASPAEMVATASILGLSGLGIADRNSVAGVVRAHAQRRDMLASVERQRMRGLADEEEPAIAPCRFQPGAWLVFADGTPDILAYPRTRKGWANLCRLLSRGKLRAEKGNCILEEWDLLEWGGEMMLAIIPDPSRAADLAYLADFEERLVRYRERLGNAVYLALAPTYDGRDTLIMASCARLAESSKIPLLATNLPLFSLPHRRSLADVVTAIREHVTIQEAGFRLAPNGERHLKPGREMRRLFRAYPQAVANTAVFFGRLTFSLDEIGHNYPDESVEGETISETLERLTWEGARWRYRHCDKIPGKVETQIREELSLIRDMQYEQYFLTVRHIVWHARHVLKILCQGRGSAANSTVCYCLGITEVDPQTTTLLFARFISTERNEPPDIDVDFEHERREEIIQYIYRHYGYRHAGLTAAVTSYRTRMAGREVAKAFGLSDDVQAALSSTVWGWSEEGLSEREARVAGLDVKDATTRMVMDHARELMGFPRHLTQHVGGFLITRDRLDEVVPIMKTAMPGRYMVEWDKDDLDTLKLLKIDVLALGMLSCLRRAFEMMETHYGDVQTLDDLQKRQEADVYDMICRADTIGVFQIESRAQMSMLPRLKPRKFYDLVVEVAIVRPGPIQGNMVHPYLKRREDELAGRPISYPSPELKEVLKRTLGVPLFQEQAMQIAITGAGFKPEKADRLRRSMATFKRSGRIDEFRQDFLAGMLKDGKYTREFAESCFSQIEGFAEYGFPESHAASFALLVYASSWIKTYYPDVFCAALLNAQPMGFYAPSQLVRDAREHGVAVMPVDVNLSSWDCTLEESPFDPACIDRRHQGMRGVIKSRHAVRLGLRQIKGLSQADGLERLVGNRGSGYRSVEDLWRRSGLDRNDLERLADADAFRSLGLGRREALWAVRGLDRKAAATPSLFDGEDRLNLRPEQKIELPRMLDGEEVIEDYRALQLSLKAHPVSFLRDHLRDMGVLRSVDLLSVRNGTRVTIGGIVLVRQRPGSARGVVFMTLEDETGVANAIVWPKVFEKFRPIVMGARLVRIRGRLQSHSGVIHTVVEHIEDLTPMLGLLQKEARRFGVTPRADETLQSGGDARQRKISRSAPAPRQREDGKSQGGPPDDPGLVMPKGRNFH